MVAGLLYLIGLVAVLGTIAVIGYQAPTVIANFSGAMDARASNVLEAALDIGAGFGWALAPLVGGLALMGFGRVIMLLGDIRGSLRGVN
jgi:hypothetical protein